jgi:hypothetical protein
MSDHFIKYPGYIMCPMKKRNVVIIYANKSAILQYFKQLNGRARQEWMYLGKNVSLFLDIEKNTKENFKRIEISESLQKIAKRSRKSYIDYIGLLCPCNQDLTWWLTSISEKNPRISDFFLNTCYLQVVIDHLTHSQDGLIIICESRGLIDALIKNLKNCDEFTVEVYDPLNNQIQDYMKTITKSLLTFGYFLFCWNMRCILAHIYRIKYSKKRSDTTNVGVSIIHSWVDARSFSTSDSYNEVYLGMLAEKLRGPGHVVYYLTDVLPTIFYPTALKKMSSLKEDFLLMEEFLHPFDIIKAAVIGRFKLPAVSHIPRYLGFNVAGIVTEDLKRDNLDMRAAQNYLSYPIGKKLGSRYCLKSFIYSFENLMWEKMFCKIIHEVSPKTEIIGYAHSVVDPMYTFYSISEYEKPYEPLPDRIVVNGLHAKKTLAESGFSADMIFVGGALRYPDIRKSVERHNVDGLNTIVIATSAGIQETLEIIEKSIKSFGNKEGICCIIKIHPTIPVKSLKILSALPSNFSVSNEPANTLFASTDLLIYTSSAISVEAMSMGIKILHVKSDFIIDMNIFDGYDQVRSASSSHDLYAIASAILNTPPIPKESRDAIVNEFFAPVDQEIVNLFIKTKK